MSLRLQLSPGKTDTTTELWMQPGPTQVSARSFGTRITPSKYFIFVCLLIKTEMNAKHFPKWASWETSQPLCEPTAAPGALPVPHTGRGPGPARGERPLRPHAAPAALPCAHFCTKGSPSQKRSEPRERRGETPCALPGAVRRQHPGCQGKLARPLPRPPQCQCGHGDPTRGAQGPGCLGALRGRSAGGPVGRVPSGMHGPCGVAGVWRPEGCSAAAGAWRRGQGAQCPWGAGPGEQRCSAPLRPGDPEGAAAPPSRRETPGRGRHCGLPAAKHPGEGGGGGGGGAGRRRGRAAGPRKRQLLSLALLPPLRRLLPPPLPPASPRPFLTGRGVDLGGLPLQGHPQRRVQAGPVRHAAAGAAGEARGRLGRQRRAGHGPPLTQTPRCGGGRWHRRGLAAGAGEALSPHRARLPAAAPLSSGLGAAAGAAPSFCRSLSAGAAGNPSGRGDAAPSPPGTGEGRPRCDPRARRCSSRRPRVPGDPGLRGRWGPTAPGAYRASPVTPPGTKRAQSRVPTASSSPLTEATASREHRGRPGPALVSVV